MANKVVVYIVTTSHYILDRHALNDNDTRDKIHDVLFLKKWLPWKGPVVTKAASLSSWLFAYHVTACGTVNRERCEVRSESVVYVTIQDVFCRSFICSWSTQLELTAWSHTCCACSQSNSPSNAWCKADALICWKHQNPHRWTSAFDIFHPVFCHLSCLSSVFCIFRRILGNWTEQNTKPLGLVQCTAPISHSFLQFVELKLTTIDRCSLANCTNEFVIGAVCRTVPITMLDELTGTHRSNHFCSVHNRYQQTYRQTKRDINIATSRHL